MTIRRLRSTDGSDSDNGSTWALAKATLAGALSGLTGGDTVYVSHVHAEAVASAANLFWTSPTTPAAPISIICVNDGADPPTAVATTGVVATTGNNGIGFNGDVGTPYAYVYGLNFNAGNSTGLASISIATSGSGNHYKFESCVFSLMGTGTTSRIAFGSAVLSRITLTNCQFRFSNTSQLINVQGKLRIDGGSFVSGTTSPSVSLFGHPGSFADVEVVGLDMTNLDSAVTLVAPGSISVQSLYRFIGCKLPPSWSGDLVSASPPAMSRIELINCDAGATNYRYWLEVLQGSLKHSTTIYRNSGYSVDGTHIGYILTSNANCKFPLSGLQSGWLVPKYNSTTGSPVTATVEFATNNITIKDDEVVLELFYLGSSSAPLYTRISSEKATFLTTAANLATSSETWTSVPGTPVKQKVSVTFTPQMAGLVLARVSLFKASTTVYLDPLVTLT